MIAYVLRRLFYVCVTLLFMSFFVFILIHIIPGNPVEAMLAHYREPELIELYRKEFRLDEPLPMQYVAWLTGVLRGDFGISIWTRQPVRKIIADSFEATFFLAVLSVLLASTIGLLAGSVAASSHLSWKDTAISVSSFIWLSTPAYFLGILLILVFSLQLKWLPSMGYVRVGEGVGAWIRSLILPVLSVGVINAASVARMMRTAMLDVMSEEYIRTARAKGLAERWVILRHGLRNALLPALTVIGLQLGYMMGGIVVVENVFAIPGLGRQLLASILQRDYPVLQFTVLFIGAFFVLINLAVDLAYGLVDPRVRYE